MAPPRAPAQRYPTHRPAYLREGPAMNTITTSHLPRRPALWDTTRYGFTLRVLALPNAPKIARDNVTRTLVKWGLDDEHIGIAVLIVSELVTNAVMATGRATGPLEPQPDEDIPLIRTNIQHYITTTSIAVWDTDPTPPTILEQYPDAEHGRGLHLVTMLSDEWRHYPYNGGKTIWCQIETP